MVKLTPQRKLPSRSPVFLGMAAKWLDNIFFFSANCVTVEYGNAFLPPLKTGEQVTLRWTDESIGIENTLMTIWYQNRESSWSFRESIFNINYPVIEEDPAANALFPEGVTAIFGNKSIEFTIKKLLYNYTGFYVFQIGKAPRSIHINKIFGR